MTKITKSLGNSSIDGIVALVSLAVLMVGCAQHQRMTATVIAPFPASNEPFPLSAEIANAYSEGEQSFCGAYALAYALAFGFQDYAGGNELVEEMMSELDEGAKASRRARGFTLQDLADAAKRRGYRASGMQLSLPALAQAPVPSLLHLKQRGRYHYIAFLGIEHGYAQVWDPNGGRMQRRLDDLAKNWTGYSLILQERR